MSNFVVCFMSQNFAVVENKRVLPVLVPIPGIIFLDQDMNTFQISPIASELAGRVPSVIK